jgi:hypothetical protein
LAPGLVDGALIASPWVLLGLKRGLGGRVSLPRLAVSGPGYALDFRQVFRRGVFVFGVAYFAIWGVFDFVADGPNPFFWQAQLFIFTGHWLSWLNVLCLVLWCGRGNLTRGLFSAGYFYAVHEGLWLVMMVLVRLYEAVFVVVFYGYLAAFLIGCLALYFLAFRTVARKKELQVLVLLVLFDAFWMLLGFHVSYDGLSNLPNFTTLYTHDLGTQLTEVGGWTLPSAPLYMKD